MFTIPHDTVQLACDRNCLYEKTTSLKCLFLTKSRQCLIIDNLNYEGGCVENKENIINKILCTSALQKDIFDLAGVEIRNSKLSGHKN